MNDEQLQKESLTLQTYTPIDQLLFETRNVFVHGLIDSNMALNVNRQLLALEKTNSEAPIFLWINSPGGEVYSGFAIYDTLQLIKPRIITIISGAASSMGSVISLAAKKEDRVALPNSKILIHQPLIGGAFRGNASEIDIHARDIIALKKKMHQFYADRTGHPVETFVEMMERDRWVDPKEAIELGLISKIISSREELKNLIS